ncbi:hypothetical protein CKM354_000635600 [Cercospora kikuchii]|uniref:F-box domain-containing protein n=1 Tax=Cercospora kikuchii TaxID=84275 RepID=A0A9P3CJ82_9PEZI|nr:uncharacterized protein CKM354_000635600 [Cercospora kikuchii]GIZ43116.1 hypothetical protein CKM354_000635600 [Cercospora kikuchii]
MAQKSSIPRPSGPAQRRVSQTSYSGRSTSARKKPMYPRIKKEERPCHLLSLPRELRDMIYQSTFTKCAGYILVHVESRDPLEELHELLALMCTCKQTRRECAKVISTLDLQVYIPCWVMPEGAPFSAIRNYVKCLFTPLRSVHRMEKLYDPDFKAYRSIKTPPMSLNALPWRSIEFDFGIIEDSIDHELRLGLVYLTRLGILRFLRTNVRRAKVVAEAWSGSTGLVRFVIALRSNEVVLDSDLEPGIRQSFAEMRNRIVEVGKRLKLPIRGVSVEEGSPVKMKMRFGVFVPIEF